MDNSQHCRKSYLLKEIAKLFERIHKNADQYMAWDKIDYALLLQGFILFERIKANILNPMEIPLDDMERFHRNLKTQSDRIDDAHLSRYCHKCDREGVVIGTNYCDRTDCDIVFENNINYLSNVSIEEFIQDIENERENPAHPINQQSTTNK